jgi:hypothetical protein
MKQVGTIMQADWVKKAGPTARPSSPTSTSLPQEVRHTTPRQAMRKFLDKLYLRRRRLGAVFVALIGVLMIAQSILREFRVAPAPSTTWWPGAAPRPFFAMAHAFKHGDFVRVTLLLDSVPPKPAVLLRSACLSIGSVAVAYLAWWANLFTYESWEFNEVSQGLLPIPIWIPQAELRARLHPAAGRGVDELIIVLRGGKPTFVCAKWPSAMRAATSPRTSELQSTPLSFPFYFPDHGHPPDGRRPAAAGHDAAAFGRRVDRHDAGHLRLGRPGLLHHHLAGQQPVSAFWESNASWELAALPLFIWMGEILFRTKLSEEMFEGLRPWLNRVPGRLMHTTILGCGIFGSVSGSSAATCATISKVALPELIKRGYSEKIALGSLATAGTLGILIPPSITMVVYAVAADASIIRIFLAGFLPGFLLMALFSGYIIWWSLRHPDQVPAADPPTTFAEDPPVRQPDPLRRADRVHRLGADGGYATATECAAYGVAGSLGLACGAAR